MFSTCNDKTKQTSLSVDPIGAETSKFRKNKVNIFIFLGIYFTFALVGIDSVIGYIQQWLM